MYDRNFYRLRVFGVSYCQELQTLKLKKATKFVLFFIDHQVNITSFVPNAPFLYLLKILRLQIYGFLMFLWGRERMHWERMGSNDFEIGAQINPIFLVTL